MENKVQDRTASRKKRNVYGFFSMIGANRVRPYGVRWWMELWYIFGNMIPRSTAIHRGEYGNIGVVFDSLGLVRIRFVCMVFWGI